MLEREKEEEGGREKYDDDSDYNNNDSLPIVEFTNINRMELRGINSYIIKILIPAMAKDTANEGNGMNEDDENVAVGGDDDENDAVNDWHGRRGWWGETAPTGADMALFYHGVKGGTDGDEESSTEWKMTMNPRLSIGGGREWWS